MEKNKTKGTQNSGQPSTSPPIHHGQLYQRDYIPPRSRYFSQGKFGRLFPALQPFAPDTKSVRDKLMELGKLGGVMDAGDSPQVRENPNNPDNPDILAGFTFLGQFLDHDITFDPTSSLERQNDPESIQNFRTPLFELDSVYGSGRAASPHLYDSTTGNVKFLLDAAAPNDLPRNSQNTALIGDPRNDENLIVSQLHVAFLKFHNAMVDRVKQNGVTNPNEAFSEAQRLVRWHYQWIIVHEFLPKTVGQSLVDEVLHQGRRFYDWRHEPFIPVEFAVAAYRFGHSQVRAGYRVNVDFAAPIFNEALPSDASDPDDLSGGKRAPRRFVDWKLFFDVSNGGPPQPGKAIDVKLSTPLFALPFIPPNLPDNPRSLAQRNLLRHLTFGLPSGQCLAKAMRIVPLSSKDLADVQPLGFDSSTPLWLYILKESEVVAQGKRLGPLGGRIVCEVFLGLLEGDRLSYLRQEPDWTPTLESGKNFKMADLLRVAGVVS